MNDPAATPTTTRTDVPHDRLAALWSYPDETTAAKVADARSLLLGTAAPEAATLLDPLVAAVERLSPEELEELFTRTFDVNPVCTLECGWHLFGEDYARGELLVRMRVLMRSLGVEESAELPDHLSHVLPVLGRLPEAEGRAFAREWIAPAMRKMLAGFQDPDNPYRDALRAVLQFLAAHHGFEAGLEEGAADVSTAAAGGGAPVEERSHG